MDRRTSHPDPDHRCDPADSVSDRYGHDADQLRSADVSAGLTGDGQRAADPDR